MTEWARDIDEPRPSPPAEVIEGEEGRVGKRKKKKAGLAQFMPMFGASGERLGVAGRTQLLGEVL